MAESDGARNTVIAIVIGLAAGFLAVTAEFALLFVIGTGFTDVIASGSKSSGFFMLLVPNLCVACILGFSVWLQSWTRRLSYSWLACTLSAMVGALVAAVLGAVFNWLRGSESVFSYWNMLPFVLGSAGDFGGAAFYVGRRERRLARFFLAALGIGAALPVMMWLVLKASLGSNFWVFATPLIPIAYFAAFHLFLDFLWRSGSANAPRDSGGQPIARWAVVLIFVGAPLLVLIKNSTSNSLPFESYAWVLDVEKLRKQIQLNPKIPNLRNEEGITLLHQAALTGNPGTVELLIENGADVNAASTWGKTPLHEAARRGPSKSAEAVAIAELLIKNKADPNALAKLDGTPLHCAALFNNVKMIELLIQNGAMPDAPDGDMKKRPLHIAAHEGFVPIGEALLKGGANVNAADFMGETALHKAIQRNRAEFVEFLIKNGADVNAKGQSTATPLSLALEKGFTNIAEMLKAHGAVETPQKSAKP